MNVAGITLNLVCLGFLLFLLLLYFSKKNMNNVENKVYRYLLFDDLLLILTELAFLFSSYFIPSNLFLVGLFKRFNFFFIILFFILIALYVIIICIENNKNVKEFFKKHERTTLKIILFGIFVIAIIEFSIPIKYYYNSEGALLYAYGPCCNDFSGVIGSLIVIIIVPFIVANWKHVERKKLAPFIVVSILEFITLGVSVVNPALCMAAFSISMTCYLMFFTIENPDLKMITELTLAKTQAEKSNNAKSDFLSSMSHEIRTPLNAIVGLSQMIKSSDDIEDIHNDTDDIIMASQNLLELVNGILDINKLEANKMEIVETEYRPAKTFEDLTKLMKIRLGRKPIEFRTYYSDKLPELLYGDREKVKQVITNLITNAIKYTDEGSIDFNVDCDIKDDKCTLKIIVSDTGRGIRDDQKEYLFTKFYRLEEDKDSDIQGTGLGLAITKSIVDLFGGKITVDSKFGEGSTFYVELTQKIVTINENTEVVESKEKVEIPVTQEVQPVVDSNITEEIYHDEVTTVEEKTETKEKINEVVDSINTNFQDNNNTNLVEDKIEDSDKPKILMVVDDNKLNLRVASKLLQELNFEIETANSGAECIEKVKNDNKYDLIFMDIMMPNMNGVETMHKLKEMENFKIPVIALTADAMEGSREKYMGEGFDEYVSKPIEKDVLEETISKYINMNPEEKSN